jgi:hypothetical protein
MVLLTRDPSTGNVTVLLEGIDPDDVNVTSGQVRKLQTSDIQVQRQPENLRTSTVPGLLAQQQHSSSSERFLYDEEANKLRVQEIMEGLNASVELFFARNCSCYEPHYPTVYCPLATKSCYPPSPSSGNQIPGCQTVSKNADRSKTLLLILSVWFGLLFGSLALTDFGTEVIEYFISRCFPGVNHLLVDRILRRDPERAHRLLMTAIELRHQRLFSHANNGNGTTRDDEGEARRSPTALLLRTKIYQTEKPKNNAAPEHSLKNKKEGSNDCSSHRLSFSMSVAPSLFDDDDEAINCAICFAPLLDGERVGELSCDHLYHAECLKFWLQRRNVCPLCQATNVATPRYDDIPTNVGTSPAEAEIDVDEDEASGARLNEELSA